MRIVENCKDEMIFSKYELSKRFETKICTEARDFLGPVIRRNKNEETLNLSERRYTIMILERFGMAD